MSILLRLPSTIRQLNYLVRVYNRAAEVSYHRTWRLWSSPYLDLLTGRDTKGDNYVPNKTEGMKQEESIKEEPTGKIKLSISRNVFRILRPDKSPILIPRNCVSAKSE